MSSLVDHAARGLTMVRHREVSRPEIAEAHVTNIRHGVIAGTTVFHKE